MRIQLYICVIILTFFITTQSHLSYQALHASTNNETCTYQSNKITLYIYDAIGKIKFKLTAYRIQHFPNQKSTWFIYPNITVFNTKNIPSWKITANQAELNDKKILYLHGHTHIDNLTNNAYLKSITTNQVTINLITQDIITNEKVIIYGRNFYSTAICMHANLYTQTIKLMDNIQTYYDIQHTW